MSGDGRDEKHERDVLVALKSNKVVIKKRNKLLAKKNSVELNNLKKKSEGLKKIERTHLLDLIIVSEMQLQWTEKISSKQKSCTKEKMLRD